MRDWSKLTVAKLKEELDRLGLPKTGLKAALVQRLEEAEAQKESEEAAPETNEDNESAEGAAEPVNNTSTIPAPAVTEPAQAQTSQSSAPEAGAENKELEQKKVQDVHGNEGAKIDAAEDAKIMDAFAETKAASEQNLSDPPVPDPPQSDILPGNLTQTGSREGTIEAQLPTPNPTQQDIHAGQTSTQTSVAPEELAEDSRKRKRRSKSPPPSSLETSKKLKQDGAIEERPDVRLPEDDQATQAEGVLHQGQVQANGHLEHALETEPAATDDQNRLRPTQAVDAADMELEQKAASRTPSPQRIKSDAMKSPTADRRFKALTSPTTKPVTGYNEDPSDISVPPALHPATAALYVRNLMRPLNPSQFKAHLTALASSTGESDDAAASTITKFHVDPIRTHALVLFTNIASASRVRAQLHDRVWPNERDRKPLWIDFIPEEKVDRWIEVETEQTSSGGGRNNNNKRWEVVYEETDGDDGSPTINAYLQEAGPSSSSAPGAPSAAAATGSAGRTLAARIEKSSPSHHATAPSRAAAVTESQSKEFAALDDLFRSTTAAKPKIYFLPHKTESEVVTRRLEILRRDEERGPPSHRGGDEMRRFSFAGERVVDKGPEFGYGRGGGRGRGGGYRGRGGDTYRGREGGDGWRGGGRRGDRAW